MAGKQVTSESPYATCFSIAEVTHTSGKLSVTRKAWMEDAGHPRGCLDAWTPTAVADDAWTPGLLDVQAQSMPPRSVFIEVT